MDNDDVFQTYNIDSLIDIYNTIKEKAFYSDVLNLHTRSSDFIHIIMKHVIYYEKTQEEIEGDGEYIFEVDK